MDMTKDFVYPTDLWQPLCEGMAHIRKQAWFNEPLQFPCESEFKILANIAFQASLLTEEGRRPGFRLVFCNSENTQSLENSEFSPLRVVRFTDPRPFSVAEVNRIAPAADLTRFLVCVGLAKKGDKALQLWGLLEVGDNWSKFMRHEVTHGTPPPNFLTIVSSSPGEMSLSVGGDILLMLRGGSISKPVRNPIWDGPIADFLKPSRARFYQEVIRRVGKSVFDDEGADEDYPQKSYNWFLERILYNVRNIGHGGTIIMVSDILSSKDPRLKDRVLLKYASVYDYAWESLVRSLVLHHEYYDIKSIDSEGGLTSIQKQSSTRWQMDIVEDELQDIANGIATLTGVDGALVMTTDFKVLGFGGEILATSHALDTVIDSSDKRRKIRVDSFGTRHRSAFRFCSSLEDSFAFIVSSDGGVKAAKRDGDRLLFWSDINEGEMGL